METTTAATVRVWVGDLSAYNNGKLVGEWVDGDDLDALYAAYDAATHGGRYDFELMDVEAPKYLRDRIGSYSDAHRVYAAAVLADVLDTEGIAPELADAWNDATCGIDDYLAACAKLETDAYPAEADYIARQIWEGFMGEYDSREDWAQSYAEDAGMLTDGDSLLMAHIDWAGVARELEYDCYVVDLKYGGIAVFMA